MSTIIVHVDLDAFYVQVERHQDPSLVGQPCAVVQYNAWEGGAIIALSYEAKALGVRRNMRGDEARRLCPTIRLVTVRVKNEKADLEVYREAGTSVFEQCALSGALCERTSIDEAYLDVTQMARKMLIRERQRIRSSRYSHSSPSPSPSPSPLLEHNTNILCMPSKEEGDAWLRELMQQQFKDDDDNDKDDFDLNLLLVAGSFIVRDIRRDVLDVTGYTLSAGIATNKMLAKMISGKFKPNQQTMLRTVDVRSVLSTLPLRDLNGFGGKLGDGLIQSYKISTVGELSSSSTYTLEKLTHMCTMILGGSEEAMCEKAQWIYYVSRGQLPPNDPKSKVKAKLSASTIGCSKTFTGSDVLNSSRCAPAESGSSGSSESGGTELIQRYLLGQSNEIFDRLVQHYLKYREIPTKLVISWSTIMKTVRRSGHTVNVAGGGGSRSMAYPASALRFEESEKKSEKKSEKESEKESGKGDGKKGNEEIKEKDRSLAQQSQIETIARVAGVIIERIRQNLVSTTGSWQFTCLGIAATNFIQRVDSAGSIQTFLSNAKSSAKSTSSSSSSSFRPSSLQDIDPNALNALPEEIRNEIQADLELRRKVSKKKKKGKPDIKTKTNTLMQSFAKISSSSSSSTSTPAASTANTGAATTANTGAVTTTTTSSTSTPAHLEIPPGWDSTVFNSLPEDVQREQIQQHKRSGGSTTTSPMNRAFKKQKTNSKTGLGLKSFFIAHKT